MRGQEIERKTVDFPPPMADGVPNEGSLLASHVPGQSWHNENCRLMVEQTPKVPAKVVGGDGHLSLHVEGLHAPELTFSFEERKSGIGVGSAVGAHLLFFNSSRSWSISTRGSLTQRPIAHNVPSGIVWIASPGPGGGGGGGGNQTPEPPKKAEVPAKDKLSVPVVKKDVTPQPKLEEPKDPAFQHPGEDTR